ncbi:hypothetical protein LTE61_000107 [Salmonella enterica subsp. enterica serovar Westminster]|nr:hypothetical protein [Salmonella enterica subsp. enterica serovar Westminster]EJO5353158.1 hypothetical protein [Salmonella enterica]EJO5365853.1 hypothetical protein [Salmonella enterica]HCL5219341.1 hypothetical protein [Salmonella enterica]
MDIAKDVPEAGERGKARLAARLYIDAPKIEAGKEKRTTTVHDGRGFALWRQTLRRRAGFFVYTGG